MEWNDNAKLQKKKNMPKRIQSVKGKIRSFFLEIDIVFQKQNFFVRVKVNNFLKIIIITGT